MLIVGLTGGIGSGKSTVAGLFAELGINIVDTDALSHEISNDPAVIFEIAENFGDDITNADGRIDRQALADIVFHDIDKRRQLEAILHPRIRDRVKLELDALQDEPYVIVVVPLLLETDFHTLVDRILVVDTAEHLQIERVHKRDGRDEAVIRAIMDQQLDRHERINRADDVVDNNSDNGADIEQLRQRVADLDLHYRGIDHS